MELSASIKSEPKLNPNLQIILIPIKVSLCRESLYGETTEKT